MGSMKKKNIPITCAIITAFSVMAYAANVIIPYNYMFLMRGDGTPYDIFYNLLGGHKLFYPLCVVGMFFLYISAYYGVYFLVRKKKSK